MPRPSSIPEEILRHRPCKSVRIREDKGIYRVYKYKAVQLASGKWSNDYGHLIGKIIPEVGFVPNERYRRELAGEQKDVGFHDGVTDVRYGDYALLEFLSRDVLVQLERCFPLEDACQIYCYGLILCANGFLHVDQVEECYRESILSVQFRDFAFRMGPDALSNLLRGLGMKEHAPREFQQHLLDNSSRSIAIDGHVIRSCSVENDLAEPGYKLPLLKAPQVNLLIAYDAKRNYPLLYRTYRGSCVDKRSVIDLLNSYDYHDTKFLVDRGFYSAEVLSLMSRNGNSYIVPLPSSSPTFKRIRASLSYDSGEFVYRPSRKESARIVFHEEKIDEMKRVVVYMDVDENNSKRKSYKQSMDEGEHGYTQGNYDAYRDWWGVYFLETTTSDPALLVYADYKSRWSIETFNNYIKNGGCFNDLKIQDYYRFHGFDFVMLVTGLIQAALNQAVKTLDKSSISTVDILLKASHMRMVERDGEWRLHNTRTKDINLFSAMGFLPQQVYESPKITN